MATELDQSEIVRVLVNSIHCETCISQAVDRLLVKARAELTEEAADRVFQRAFNTAASLLDYLPLEQSEG